MKLTGHVLIALVLITLAGCAGMKNSIIKKDLPASSIERRAWLVGNWFGEIKNEEGDRQQWLVSRFPDGTYKIHFRIIKKNGGYQEQVEEGLWGVSGPIYFSIMKGWLKGKKFIPSDPTDASYYDAYEILELDSKKMKYRSFYKGILFEATKVSENFSWPEIKP